MSQARRFSRLIALFRRAFDWPSQSATRVLTCQQVTDLIADYLSGALDAATASAFEAHLRGCLNCVAFLNTYKSTIHTLRSLRYEDIPAEMEERVRRFLEAKRSRDGQGRPSSSSPPSIGRLSARLRHPGRDSGGKGMFLFPFLTALMF